MANRQYVCHFALADLITYLFILRDKYAQSYLRSKEFFN